MWFGLVCLRSSIVWSKSVKKRGWWDVGLEVGEGRLWERLRVMVFLGKFLVLGFMFRFVSGFVCLFSV